MGTFYLSDCSDPAFSSLVSQLLGKEPLYQAFMPPQRCVCQVSKQQ